MSKSFYITGHTELTADLIWARNERNVPEQVFALKL